MVREKQRAELIKTEDGSATIYLEEYGEAMHSSHGAYEESEIKHVGPSGILEKEGPLTLLDIGFGMGYNILALLAGLSRSAPGREVTIYSFEKDNYYRDLLGRISFGDERDRWYALVRRAFEEEEAREGGIHISVLFGDARKRIHEMQNLHADAVFQDPFSPAHNPELWTVEFFKALSDSMKDDAVLTTYSGALHVRGALLAAGFKIGRGPGMGKKREGTLAGKKMVPQELGAPEVKHILDQVKSTPYRDLSGNDSREEILERRLDEMARKRGSGGHK